MRPCSTPSPRSRAKNKVNTVGHNDFQENINTYLQGSPDDAFTWFAGFRMRFFARKGLAGESRRLETIGGDFTDGIKKASTGDDGKKYFVPIYNYPWALFYRKSLWADKGYTAPEDGRRTEDPGRQDEEGRLDPDRVRRQGRLAGHGHVRLPQHAAQRLRLPRRPDGRQGVLGGAKVKTVFDTWRGLLPYHQEGANGRTWQEAAQALAAKKTGMYLLGTFVGPAVQRRGPADLDFFAFPEVDSGHGTDAVEAPIDGFMMSKKAKNAAGRRRS